MKTNILVGGSFHAALLADALFALSQDFTIYTSAPRSKFGSNAAAYDIQFVPLFASIVQRISKLDLSYLLEQETLIFDRLASIVMSHCDVLYGWAGYSLKSAYKVKNRGGKFLLERSCPHVLFQEDILSREAEKLKIKYIPKSTSWIERSIAEYDLADFIVVPSNYTYNSFLEKGYAPQKLFKIELDKKVSLPPEKKWKDKSHFVVGVLGGSLMRKGFIYLLEAWERLNLPDSKLLLKASEMELRKSPAISKYLNRFHNVEILPYFKNINDFYSMCDVFCLPSVDDGFGMAVIEAMGNSLPVIITENVGAKDLIKDSEFGFVIPPNNSDEIANKIETFYKNRDLIYQMGKRAYNFVATREFDNQQGKSLYKEKIRQLYNIVN